MTTCTVIGLYSDAASQPAMRDGSFVESFEAETPATAATGLAVKLWFAWEDMDGRLGEKPDYDALYWGEHSIWRVLDNLEHMGAPERPWLHKRNAGGAA